MTLREKPSAEFSGRLGILSFLCLLIFIAGLSASCTGKNPKLAGLYLDKGLAYTQKGEYTSALKELLEARKLNPDDPVIHYYLGVSYHRKKLIPEAVAEFKEAIALKPDYAEAHNYLGMVYSEMGSWDEAIGEFKKSADNILYETPAGALNNMGYAYYRKGDYLTALAKFDEALAREPNTPIFPVIEKNRGLAYFAQGRIDAAVRHLKRSLEKAPDFIESHYWLARCYLEQKNTGAAAEEFRFIVRTVPDSEFGLKAQEGLEAIDAGRR